jgi:8-oxo-dGTP pyrophosphatase MutT (NUDIX family)
MATLIHGDRIGKTARLSLSCSGFIFNTDRTKLLLTRRTDNGRWCLPSGRIDHGESISEAVVREVLEETGLQTVVRRLMGVWCDPDVISTYPDGTRWQCAEIDVEMEVIGGLFGASDETDKFGYFGIDELGTIDLMEIETERVQRALNGDVPYIK